MMVISPLDAGGWVNSQLFDHTSVLRFLEKRFGVAEPNISPWRRAICGDLTSIFDFDVPLEARRDTRWLQALPSVAGYIAETEQLCKAARRRPSPPPRPCQHRARHPSRARAALSLCRRADLERCRATGFINDGPVGIVFGVQDEIAFPGWRYVTVAAGSRLKEDWPLPRSTPCPCGTRPQWFSARISPAPAWSGSPRRSLA
jgi:phospholipase C